MSTHPHFCRKYDIIGLYKPWQQQKEAFDSCSGGYTDLDLLDNISNDDLDLIVGDTDYPTDTFNVDRNSKDINVYNGCELILINMRCDNDMHMLNGLSYDYIDGNITYIAKVRNILVDYIITSTSSFFKMYLILYRYTRFF